MAEETMSQEEPAQEEKRKGSGPGFFLGLIIGGITGAAAATLFAPTAREEMQVGREVPPGPRPGEATPSGLPPEAPPVERIRAMLDRVRSRVNEATEEGRRAAREAEAESRARYTELTHREPEV